METVLWIDIESGTYGNKDTIRLLRVTDEEADKIAQMSDSERVKTGSMFGTAVADSQPIGVLPT